MTQRGNTVLLMDDSPLVRCDLRWALESDGFQVLEAFDNSEAVRLYRIFRPIAVLIDLVCDRRNARAAMAEIVEFDSAATVLARDGGSQPVRVEEVLTELRAIQTRGIPSERAAPKPRVLSIEPDPIARSIVRKNCEAAPFDLVSATSVQDGIQRWSGIRPALVLISATAAEHTSDIDRDTLRSLVGSSGGVLTVDECRSGEPRLEATLNARLRECLEFIPALIHHSDADMASFSRRGRLAERVINKRISSDLVDELTGTLNREGFRYFEDTLPLRPKIGYATIVMLDIDYFKSINDTYGHAAGDDAIKGLADVLRSLAPDDSIGRLGGEEFAVLCDSYHLGEGVALAEQIRERVAETIFGNHQRFRFTVSCGVAEFIPGEEQHDWYDRADAALYVAKREGRNRTELSLGDALTQPALAPGDVIRSQVLKPKR